MLNVSNLMFALAFLFHLVLAPCEPSLEALSRLQTHLKSQVAPVWVAVLREKYLEGYSTLFSEFEAARVKNSSSNPFYEGERWTGKVLEGTFKEKVKFTAHFFIKPNSIELSLFEIQYFDSERKRFLDWGEKMSSSNLSQSQALME